VGREWNAPAQVALRGSERAREHSIGVPMTAQRCERIESHDVAVRGLTARAVEPTVPSLVSAVVGGSPSSSQAEIASRSKGLRAVGACLRPLPGDALAYPRRPLRAPAPVRTRVSVFAVGARVCVADCAGDRSVRATLTDHAGNPLGSLSGGTEVAILAWQPDWAGTTRYHVRVADSQLEGWLPVGNLRSREVAIPPALTGPPAPAAAPRVNEFADSPRVFGRRPR
jgi:hypothetical protein